MKRYCVVRSLIWELIPCVVLESSSTIPSVRDESEAEPEPSADLLNKTSLANNCSTSVLAKKKLNDTHLYLFSMKFSKRSVKSMAHNNVDKLRIDIML